MRKFKHISLFIMSHNWIEQNFFLRKLRCVFVVSMVAIYLPLNNGLYMEKKFCQAYGNAFNESGVWPIIRRSGNTHPALLMTVCNQSHYLANLGPGNAEVFQFRTETLLFNDTNYKPIQIDLIMYAMQYPNSTLMNPTMRYITKGLKPDCVFYLDPANETKNAYYLSYDHICGIDFAVRKKE